MPTFAGKVSGRQIILNVAVCPPDRNHEPSDLVSALLDTGATKSGITPGLVKRLGLEANEWGRLTGIHGPQDVLLYRVAMVLPISDGGTTYLRGQRSLEVAEITLPESSNFEVILGMDFLHPFHLTLFQDSFILSN